MNLPLYLLTEDARTVTIGWEPPVGCAGYVFYSGTQRLSSTLDPTRKSVKVAKSNLPVTVSALRTLSEGVYPPPVTPPPPTGSVPFGSRPAQAPPAGPLFGPGAFVLDNKHIKWTNPNGSSLNLQNFLGGVTITNCDFEGPGAYIYMLGCRGQITIRNCRFKNVGHNAIQLDKCIMPGTVSAIKVRGGVSEDVISVYESGGTDATNRMVFDDIHIEGGDGVDYQRWTSGSGSGIMNERAQYVTFRNFTLLNPGQVGLGTHLDKDVIVRDFSIYTEQSYPSRGLGNVGYDAAQSPQSSPLETSNGKVKWLLPDGAQNNYTVLNGGAQIVGFNTNQWGYNFTAAEIAALRVTFA